MFPVADADTGTNMSATMNGALADLESDPAAEGDAATVAGMAQALAEAALLNSVGNSGIILAQFLDGLAAGMSDAVELDALGLAAAAEQGVTIAYQAMSEPREGTILSVMSAWSRGLTAAAAVEPDPSKALATSLGAAQVALAHTQQQLAVLTRAGLTDAGGEGFFCFLRGLHLGMSAPNATELDAASREQPFEQAGVGSNLAAAALETQESLESTASKQLSAQPPTDYLHAFMARGEPVFRYCTEIIVDGINLDATRLRAELADLGDSLIVVGRHTRLKVHLHCDRPDQAAERLARHGRLGRQKVDDMRLQYRARTCPLAASAVVTDSSCDLPPELLDRWQIHQVPMSIRWGEDQYIDRRTLSATNFYRDLQTKALHPTTAQPPPERFERLYRLLADNHRSILSVHLSSHLSGTMGVARLAAGRVPEANVQVLDCCQVSTGLGLTLLDVAETLSAGVDADSDAETLARLVQRSSERTEILVALESLDAMLRSGRISGLKAKAAGLLGLLPVVSLDRQGRAVSRAMAFSFQGGSERILARIARRARRSSAERWAIAHAAAAPAADRLAERIGAVLGSDPNYIMQTSPMLGVHAGAGSVCVAVQWQQETD